MIKKLKLQKKYILNLMFLITITFIFIFLIITKFETNISAEPNNENIRLPIIMYHSIVKDKNLRGKFVITPSEFENDVIYLKEHGYNTVFMKDVIDYVYGENQLPDKPIILTFDDGYYNNYLYAFSIIKKYNFKMVISPIGKYVDLYSENPSTNDYYAHVTWNNLKEMQNSDLVEIQNHSYNMHTMSKGRNGTKKKPNENIHDYKKVLIEDINLMQKRISENLSKEATTFVYPFGAISTASIDILKEMGFKATLGCENKMNYLNHDPEKLYGLCRFIRESNISSEKFFKFLCEE